MILIKFYFLKQNPRTFWKYVNNKTKNKGKISVLNDLNNKEVSDDFEKAEILNNHFASVFTKENLNNIPDFNPEFEDIDIIENLELKDSDIKKLLLNLDPSKSAGPDGINGRVLKELASEISSVLSVLYNKSIQEGQLPYQWKEANVIALFKKGSRKSANNYRPVSLTSICCKLLEKLIRNAIVDNLEKKGLIHKDQHGFRYGRSISISISSVNQLTSNWGIILMGGFQRATR